MVTYNKFNQFVADVHNGKHNLGADTLKVFLCAAANAPVATNSVLANLTEISYTNLSSRTLTVTSSTQTSGTYSCVVNDLTLTASGTVATFRYVGVYNDTPTSPADPLICWYDHGSDVTMTAGQTFLINFGASLFQDT